MKALPYREVHLDFHTSEAVPAVGDRFDKEQFKAALKAGNVDSITVFSKCHHGWAYHPSTANEMHPKLKFDLLGAELEACREAGVNAPVYISAGLDEKYARRHPENLVKGSPNAGHDFLNAAHYHLLCYNTPYLDYLMAQVEEVMQRYNPTGVFLDISAPRICYCQHCIESMRAKGLDPHNPDDVRRHGDMVYAEYCRRTEEVVRTYNPETRLFHNAGNITRGRRDHAVAYDLRYRFSADFDWCIRVMKQSTVLHNTHLTLIDYLNEGMTTRNHRASLRERFRIMCRHYGTVQTVALHLKFALRLLYKK